MRRTALPDEKSTAHDEIPGETPRDNVLAAPAHPPPKVMKKGGIPEPAMQTLATPPPPDPDARDRRLQHWILFGLGVAAASLVVVWLGFQLFAGDEAASKIALSFLSGLLGFVLRRPSA